MNQKIKALFIFLTIFFGILGLAGSSEAATFINEGFEGGTFDGTPEGYIGSDGSCTTGGTECSVSAGTCTECSGDWATPNKGWIQSSIVHSGTKAFKGQIVDYQPDGQCGSAGFKLVNSRYGVGLLDKFYIRFYIKFDPDFRFSYSGKILAYSGNCYFISRGAPNINTWQYGSEVDNSPYGTIGVYSSHQESKEICDGVAEQLANIPQKRQCDYDDGSAWVIDLTNPNHLGWWYFEIMYDLAGDKFSVWVRRPADTSITQVYNEMPWDFNPGIDHIDFIWWNHCGPGLGGGIFYVDDVVVADQYIGPISQPDTTPPAAPTGVTIN